MATHDQRTTYYKRLGWPKDPEITACKGCGDSSTHKYPLWMSRECKPVMIPDQWHTSPCISFPHGETLPEEISDEDVSLMKPWDEREELEDHYCATCTQAEDGR